MLFVFSDCVLIFNRMFSLSGCLVFPGFLESGGFVFDSAEALWILLTQEIGKNDWLRIPALQISCINSDSTSAYGTNL